MPAECTIFQYYNFHPNGENHTFNNSHPDFRDISRGDFGLKDWNDDPLSFQVRYGTWRLYEHINYEGFYHDFTPGSYEDIVAKLGHDKGWASSIKLLSYP